MKKNIILTVVLALFISVTSCNKSDLDESIELNNFNEKSSDLLLKSDNKGFDAYGYNWNARHFNGYLMNAWFGDNIDPTVAWFKKEPFNGDIEAYQTGYPEVLDYPFWMYGNMTVVMHWNESLISNEGVYQFPWVDSDAWITMHYKMGEGENKWSQFQKFVAVKSSDLLVGYYFDDLGNILFGEYFSENGESVGWYYMWTDLALIQVVNTGNVPEEMLPKYKSPMSPGLGKYKIH